MRRMILPLMLLAVACHPTELSKEQQVAIMDEMIGVMDGWWDAWRAADFARGIAYLYDHPMSVYGTEGRTVEGFQAIDSVLRPAFATVASQEINIDGGSRFMIAQDAVYVMEYGT